MIPPTASEWIVLVLRIVFVLSLYALLIWVALNVRRGIARVEESGDRADRLVVVASPRGVLELNTTFQLGDVTSIGRGLGNNVVLPDEAVSGQHAKLLWDNKHWTISDVGSTNGTLVNGKPVASTTALRIGDTIRIGPIELRLSK